MVTTDAILYISSFFAGVLTILAPCVLPLLPIIIGGSLSSTNFRRPLLITASLATSVVLFTLMLRVTTAFVGVPLYVWEIISGVIVGLLGLFMVFPNLWTGISVKLGLEHGSQKLLQDAGAKKEGVGRDILTGAALGPVFLSCSPTFGIIIGTVFPVSFTIGLINLGLYALGLSLMMLLVSWLGQLLIKRLKFALNPDGWFRRGLGVLFVIVGIMVATGLMKQIEIYFIDQGYIGANDLEYMLSEKLMEDTAEE